MNVFDNIFPFVKKEFGKEVLIDSTDGSRNTKCVAYIKNKALNNQNYFNDKTIYCESEIKPGDIVKCENFSYMCIRQEAKYKNYWVDVIRRCDFVTKFVVGTEVKIANSYYLRQNFSITEGYNVVISDSVTVCVIPDYAWSKNLTINQKFIQFGFKWTISGIDKTNKGLVYIHAKRGEAASNSENISGIPDGSEIYSTQILWEEFPSYLEAGNRYPIKATLYKQLPDLTWIPTVDKILYRTEDSSVAYVDEKDLLNCLKEGKTRIYAEWLNDYSKNISKDITINPAFVDYKIAWTNSVDGMYTDDVYKFTAQLFRNDVAITVPILYEISDEYKEIAELGVNGNVTAKKAGTFVITATWVDNPNYKVSKTVKVTESVYTVKFYKYTNKLKLNSKTSFEANAYKNGIIDPSKPVRYSSDNMTTVQIDATTGEVNPVGLGKAKVKAFMADNLAIYEEVDTEVFEIVYSIIWKQQITSMMYLGQKYKIEAVVGVDLEPDLTKKVGYRSSNDGIVKVDSEGNVEPVSEGDAELTAYYVDDESIYSTLFVHVSTNEYTIEWINPETPNVKFISYGDYTNFFNSPVGVDLGVIVKRDGVDVTKEYDWKDLYHFKKGYQYTANFNGRYSSWTQGGIFKQIDVTISVPNIPNSPTLRWEGAIVPTGQGYRLEKLVNGEWGFPNSSFPRGDMQLVPDKTIEKNGIVLGQETLSSLDIWFLISDGYGVNLRWYLFKYSDIFTEGVLVQTYTQSIKTGDYYESDKRAIPPYVKEFFDKYPDVIYPKIESLQPEVITAINTPRNHFAYLKGNKLSVARIYTSVNNYFGITTYQDRATVEVKKPNGIGIHMTYGKNIYPNRHNGIMAYATLNGERLDDNGMVFEIVDSGNMDVELRKFPKIIPGHYGKNGRPNINKTILDTDDGWSAFSDAYKQRTLYVEQNYNNVSICPYPYNRDKLDNYRGNKNDYFVSQNWKFQRDESNEIVFENDMRDVFIHGSVSSQKIIKIKAYHKDYPNFFEIRDFKVCPSIEENLCLYFSVKTNTLDTIEYDGTIINAIRLEKEPDSDHYLLPTEKVAFPGQYDYVSLYVGNSKAPDDLHRYEDRYDLGYWNISFCREIESPEQLPSPDIREGVGTTNYPRQTVVNAQDFDQIVRSTLSIYVQPASLLVDSSRKGGTELSEYYDSPGELQKEIEYYNTFPKVRNTGVQQVNHPNTGELVYCTNFSNMINPYEEHVVNDAIWIDKNYDSLTGFINKYGTKNGLSPYPNGKYEDIDMDDEEGKRLHQIFMYVKLMLLYNK